MGLTGLGLLLLDFSDAEYDLPLFLLQKKIKNDFALFKISFSFFDGTKVVITSEIEVQQMLGSLLTVFFFILVGRSDVY